MNWLPQPKPSLLSLIFGALGPLSRVRSHRPLAYKRDCFVVWCTRCRPCKGMKPKFAELAASEPNVVCLAVNVGELGDLAEAYGVSSLPSFRLIKYAWRWRCGQCGH
jgi:thiol-disulfide isomerase/thioredoxin